MAWQSWDMQPGSSQIFFRTLFWYIKKKFVPNNRVFRLLAWWQTWVLVNKMLWNDFQHSLLQLHLEGGGWYLDLLSGMVPTEEQTFSKDCKQKLDQQQKTKFSMSTCFVLWHNLSIQSDPPNPKKRRNLHPPLLIALIKFVHVKAKTSREITLHPCSTSKIFDVTCIDCPCS